MIKTSLSISPIGIVNNSKKLKFDVPHQPDKDSDDTSTIELFPGHNFEQALSDLKGFSHIWLVWWFHKNSNWKPMVLPPRGAEKKRGVFATRSPHRPNPIGLTVVPLIQVKGRILTIGSCDLIDGTPLLDIKPYISEIDAFYNTKSGWLAKLETKNDQKFQIIYSKIAEKQLNWLRQHNINFIERAEKILRTNPAPHRTRRIICIDKGKNKIYRMGCGAWRIFFEVRASQVRIKNFAAGYPLESLTGNTKNKVPDREQQLEFIKIQKSFCKI